MNFWLKLRRKGFQLPYGCKNPNRTVKTGFTDRSKNFPEPRAINVKGRFWGSR
jgi:hypothetical protein